MKTVDYDQADPLGVLHLNLVSLGYSLTPERVALIRQLDVRPFPFFAIYAIEDDIVAGQVGVYRLQVVTTHGLEAVGGACAVCTHPAFSGRGIATRLMEEAHERMRAAGLRFSTLGTARHRAAYALYRRLGYEDVYTVRTTMARRVGVRSDTRLRAERLGADQLDLTDDVFKRAAAGRLGFAWRHTGFIPMMASTGDIDAEAVWLLWDGDAPVGYAIAQPSEQVLMVSNLLLVEGADAAEAIAAMARALAVAYMSVRIDHESVATSLRQAGYPPAQPGWGVFMMKPLTPEVTVEEARSLLAIGTERFLISDIDVT